MSVEKTLHVQVIYIQGHFAIEWQVKNNGELEMNRVKYRNSFDDIGAEGHAVWTKTTSNKQLFLQY